MGDKLSKNIVVVVLSLLSAVVGIVAFATGMDLPGLLDARFPLRRPNRIPRAQSAPDRRHGGAGRRAIRSRPPPWSNPIHPPASTP